MVVEFGQGDEVVVIRRRTWTETNPETKEETQKTDTLEMSAVRVPEPCVIGGPGGTCEPEYIADPKNEGRDKRFLVIRLPMRY